MPSNYTAFKQMVRSRMIQARQHPQFGPTIQVLTFVAGVGMVALEVASVKMVTYLRKGKIP